MASGTLCVWQNKLGVFQMSGATLMTPDRWIKFSILTKVHLLHSDGKFFICYQSKRYTDNYKFIT